MPENQVIRALKHNDESLKEFLAALQDFNQMFCDAIADGIDFTIKLEVRGNVGEMLHARVYTDRWRRPNGVERKIEQKQRRLKLSNVS